jgi:hypothetical protein
VDQRGYCGEIVLRSTRLPRDPFYRVRTTTSRCPMSGVGGNFRRNGDHHSAVVYLCGPLWDALTRQTMRNAREK